MFVAVDLELEPGAAGHPHLGAKAEEPVRLVGLDAPEVERGADGRRLGVAAAAAEADAACEQVEEAAQAPERVAVVPAGGAADPADGRERLRRLLIRVPVLTPRLSSLWLGLVTPVYARVGRKLIESLPHETVVRDPTALERFSIRPRGYREAITRALRNEDRELAETRWSDAFSAGSGRWTPGAPVGGRLVDSREREVPLPPAQAFAPVRRIGGATGWYYGDALWRLRGFLDLLAGGVGLRRGRRDPEMPTVGAALDFWRVEAYEPDRLLRLRAEMRLPGRAWLQFEVDGDAHSSRIRQTALFDPLGLAGLAYWYALLPLHKLVFRRMLDGIAQAG